MGCGSRCQGVAESSPQGASERGWRGGLDAVSGGVQGGRTCVAHPDRESEADRKPSVMVRSRPVRGRCRGLIARSKSSRVVCPRSFLRKRTRSLLRHGSSRAISVVSGADLELPTKAPGSRDQARVPRARDPCPALGRGPSRTDGPWSNQATSCVLPSSMSPADGLAGDRGVSRLR